MKVELPRIEPARGGLTRGGEKPPLRFITGADAIGGAEQKVATLQQQIEAFRALSTSLELDEWRLARDLPQPARICLSALERVG